MALPARCKRWTCPDCHPINAYKLGLRLALTEPTHFITLTLIPDPSRSPAELLDEMNSAWRSLWKRIKRRQGDAAKGYCKVVERTRSGTPHLHIVCTIRYIPQRYLSKMWEQLTGARIVDIRRVRTARTLSKYLTKYLTKSGQPVEGRRKYSASFQWLPSLPDIPLEYGELAPQWGYSQADTTSLYADWTLFGSDLGNGWILLRLPGP